MRGGAAHIKVVDGSAVVSPAGNRAEEKELLKRKLALKNIALRKAEFALEVERSEDLAADDNFFDVGSVFGDGVDDGVAESFALIVPGAFGEFVGRVLNKAGHHVLARRCDGRVRQAGNDNVDVGLARKIAVFRIVVGAFHVLDAGRNGNRAAEMSAGAGQTLEIGEGIEREIHFAGRAAEFVAADAFEKIIGEFAGIEKFFESEMRIDAGRDDIGENFFAALQGHTASAAILDENFRNTRLRANFDASFARGVRDGVGDGSRSAAAETPGAERAVDFSHVVMQKNVGGAGRANAEKSANDAGGGHGGFQDVGFKPLVEEIGGAHGHELDECVTLVGGEAAKSLHEEMKLLEVAGLEGGGVGRNHGKERLHEAAHRGHHFGEFVVGLGVNAGVAANLALRAGVIVHAP